MTIGEFSKLIKDNNIPEDVTMLIDGVCKCVALDMGDVYFNKTTNELVFTQKGDKWNHYYYDSPAWKLLHSAKRRKMEGEDGRNSKND